MNELLIQIWTPEMQAIMTVMIVLLVALYILSIIWVARDAYMRGTPWYLWAIVALLPIVGVIAYLLLRPQLMKIDRDEQELEVALKQRELMQYGECSNCHYPVEADYLVCPHCQQRLKNQCPNCHKALDPSWTICPYCATPAPLSQRQRQIQQQREQRDDSRRNPKLKGDPSNAIEGAHKPSKTEGAQA